MRSAVRPRSPGVRGLALAAASAAALLALSPAPALAAGAHEARALPRAAHEQAPDGARVVSAVRVGERQTDLTIDSPALHGTATVRLLTPEGWERRTPGQRWPTLWLLHGCCNDYTSWTKDLDVASVAQLRHVLVVMPEAGAAGFYSDWRRLPGAQAPAWESFHLREVLPLLREGYGAGSRQAVAGLSMGGFGALSYTARHPGLFRSAASYSGVTDTLRTPADSDFVQGLVTSTGASPEALWGDPERDRKVWAAHNPADLAPALAGTPLFVSSGDGTAGPYDTPGTTDATERLLHEENVSLLAALHTAHARHLHADLYGPGTHTNPYWRREFLRSLPMLLTSVGVPAGG